VVTTDPRVDRLRLGEFGIPKRLHALRLGQDEGESLKSTDFVENLADHYLTSNREIADYPPMEGIGRGLAFVGPPGSGKTTEATKTLIEIYQRHRLHVFFVTYAGYVSMRKEQWSLQSKDAYADRWAEIQNTIESVRSVPVLLLDDVGKEHDGASGFAAKELDLLLRHRHANALPTIVTTNIPLSKWDETYNASMGSFAKEAFTRIVMARKDQRC
jgi:DNA replication protein DnaC